MGESQSDFRRGPSYEVVHVDSSLDVSSVESQGSGSINNAFWDDLMQRMSNEVHMEHEVTSKVKKDMCGRRKGEDEGENDEPLTDPPIGPSSSVRICQGGCWSFMLKLV